MHPKDSDDRSKADAPEGSDAAKPAAEYIKEARALLRSGLRRKAYSLLLPAMALYPSHPFIISYCGWLQAVVDKRARSGIALCRKSFVLFKTSDPHTASVAYPILYLNLGRSFIAAGKKKEAVDAFQKGLVYDKRHAELKKEMQHLGMRKPPTVAFLSRSNPINKLIGKLRKK